jgi:nitroreductase
VQRYDIRMNPVEPPPPGEPIPAAHLSPDTVRLMSLRRSTSPEVMTGPGPDRETLRSILTIAARAPDHRRLYPFRFIVLEGEARARLGDSLAEAFVAREPAAPAERVELERRRFMRAPLVVGVVSRVDHTHKTPEWEQVLTVGAVCQNALIAAIAHGFAAIWITEWYSYEPKIAAALGVTAAERIAGFIYIGTAREDPKERPRPDLASLITRL